MGRRAIASYLALFVHEAVGTSTELKDLDFLRGKTLEEKLEALRHVNNLGREVGDRWGIDSVMRWDRNAVSRFQRLLCKQADNLDWDRIRSCKNQGDGGGISLRRNFHPVRLSSSSSGIPHIITAISQQSISGSGLD